MTRNKHRKSKPRAKERASRRASEFAYLMQRKGLRMMRRYYKDKFEHCGIFQNYKQQIRTWTLDDLNRAIWTFVGIEFPYMLDYQRYWEFNKLEETLKTLILSDRYNKEEPITAGLNFDGVRKVLYNFNTRNLINFFSDKCFAFLYYHYFEFQGYKEAQNQTDTEPGALLKEMQELYKESEKYVKLSIDNYERDWFNSESQLEPFDDYDQSYLVNFKEY